MMPKKNHRRSKVHPITPPQFIRQHVLLMSIKDFSSALGISGSVASRYEEAGYIPEVHHDTVVELAKKAGKRVLRSWFEKVPFDQTVPQ